ncbi:hypothetical protein PPIS_a2201 [Pseudoalteromonas piscicida]|uniref:Uncharacterized protein n=1 Tax=Pseudoalteromonas piscicida TaxID=43662 RepID=A0ABM6NE55_PSEO7|nr:hypothetical protein PPIS_a2201 [Pseudoalteromonas piscicida]
MFIECYSLLCVNVVFVLLLLREVCFFAMNYKSDKKSELIFIFITP